MTTQLRHPATAAAKPGPARTSLWKKWLRSPLILSLLLALATVAVYCSVGNHDYVDYDDADYASANAHVQGGLKWENVLWAFGSGHASNWHPLTWLSHMLDFQLFGNHPGAFHLVNLALHIANALLLFFLLRRMTGALWRSAFVAALFALHPVHVESVAWISERKDVLSTLFFLLTLLAYARYVTGDGWREPGPKAEDQKPKRSTLHAPRSYALALVLFALGLMAKPMLVTLPFVLLLLDYWPLRRFQIQNQSSKIKNLSLLLLEKLPFLALSLASCIVTFKVQQKGGAVSTSLALDERLANALVSYARYIGKIFWPAHLSVLYPHPGHWPVGLVLASAALLLALTAAVIVLARRQPWLPVGWLWFVGTLVPVIGLVQVGIQSMADRYTYIPLVGLFIILAWTIPALVPPRPWRPAALALTAGFSLAACACLTARQTQFWRDSEALFARAVAVTPRNYLAYNNLGYYFSKKGKVDEALDNYRKSLEINPAYEEALNNLGYALAGRKQYQQAIPLYEAALRIRPKHVEVHNNLGNALSEIGKLDEAIAHYSAALQQNPEHADAHNNLGIALAMKGRLDEAITNFHAAIRFKPNYASAHSNLGNALAVQRKFAEAIQQFEESLRLNPNDAQAHNNLANVLSEQGRAVEAILHYQKALALNADNPEAHFNLALVLLRQHKREESVFHLQEALRLKPDYTEARKQLNTLAAKGSQ